MSILSHTIGIPLALTAGLALGHDAADRWVASVPPSPGAAVYQRCIGCHSLEVNRTGPKHCGLFGRVAGSLPGYEYSDAMRRSGIVWSRETLDAFLAAPLDAVPGTTMGFAGIRDASDRQALIDFLQQTSGDHCDGSAR